jgi:hypothetical protein
MSLQGSQDYGVDNRYRGMKPAQDDNAGKHFLNQYVERKRLADKDQVGDRPQQEGRFVMGGMGGTIPISSLPLSGISNTDAKYGFRNTFRARAH